MSALVLLIDCDVLVDFLTKREPFAENAGAILKSCKDRKSIGFIAAHSITNIFYIMRKEYSTVERKNVLRNLLTLLSVAEVNAALINKVLLNDKFDDIEDCLQSECAVLVKADYIVTRNINDYTYSAVSAILPEDFLKLQEAQ